MSEKKSQRATAHLPENITLPGFQPRLASYQGMVEFFPGSDVPAGMWVNKPPTMGVSHPNVTRMWIPASAMMALVFKAEPKAAP